MKLPKNFEDIDGMGGPERSATPWHPWAASRGKSNIPPPRPWTRSKKGSAIPPLPVGGIGRGSGVPSDLIPEPWRRFDGGAVKKNWVPLVVLGVSLAVGIGISEWASKKYIK